MAVALLPAELAGALLAVEVAWGADLTASDATWTWTDITVDVRQDPGIDISLGRADEASTTQPATCTLTLDNNAGKYSLGPQNTTNYPYVRRGTPVRIRVRPATAAAYVVVFQGNAAGWKPGWNVRANVATVALEAAGTLRRLGQGASPVLSSLRRALTTTSTVVAYWPMEDGAEATSFAPATGGRAMSWSGSPKLAENRDFDCSLPIPQLNGAVLYGDVPTHTPAADGSVSVRAIVSIPAAGAANGSVLLRAFTTGTMARAEMVYGTGGTLSLNLYDRADTLLYSTGGVGFLIDGQKRRVSLEMYEVTGTVYAGINTLQVGETNYVSNAGTTSVAGTVGLVTKVVVNPTRGLTDTAMGHVTVQTSRSATDSLSDTILQLNAYVGEYPRLRVPRLCTENAVPLAATIVSDGSTSVLDLLGAQKPGTLLSLLREVEATDQGLLYDGVSAGLAYRVRRAREDQAPALTIDASLLQLGPPFDVVDDDQRTRNSATVSRTGGGASSTYQDVTGPLGVAAVGLYDTSSQVSTQLDEAALYYAAWLVTLGTIVGYRYPAVAINLRAVPTLAAAWLTVQPGTRIDITNLGARLPGHPVRVVSLMVEGVTHRFSDGEWTGVAKCSPFDPWRVASYAADLPAGDDAWVTRVDQTGATGGSITSASASVSVTSPLPWITTAAFAGEFPFDVEVNGQQVTITAITGATTTQTFTITATKVTGTIATSAAVRLWQPTTIGL